MTDNELIALLLEAGFDNGWAFSGTQLILWEHDEDPPAPFTRPILEQQTKTTE